MKTIYSTPEVKIEEIAPQQTIAWSSDLVIKEKPGTTTETPAAKMASGWDDDDSFEETE